MLGLSIDTLIIVLPIGLMAVTVHEVAHGYVAYRLGDPTAHNSGRLTLNPMAHLDLVGTLMIALIGFGWAKPVPVNPSYFRRPAKDMMWVAMAGPVSNVLFALAYAIIWKVIAMVAPGLGDPLSRQLEPLDMFLYFGIYLNIILASFNMLPIPPLDGSRVLTYFLPPHLARRFGELDRYGMLMVAGVIFVIPWLTGIRIVSVVAGSAMSVFEALVF